MNEPQQEIDFEKVDIIATMIIRSFIDGNYPVNYAIEILKTCLGVIQQHGEPKTWDEVIDADIIERYKTKLRRAKMKKESFKEYLDSKIQAGETSVVDGGAMLCFIVDFIKSMAGKHLTDKEVETLDSITQLFSDSGIRTEEVFRVLVSTLCLYFSKLVVVRSTGSSDETVPDCAVKN